MKKKVLYITNIQVPYRVRFFNQLSRCCDLTVLYERSKSDSRNEIWSKSFKDDYKKIFLDGKKIGEESSFSFKILKYIFAKYDVIIIGCPESRVQRFAIIFMKLFRIKYIINMDGESFLKDEGIKNKIKILLLRGAEKYIVAGEKCAKTLSSLISVSERNIIPYYFSSLSNAEIRDASSNNEKREDYILIVGQYLPYKGLDIAVKIARSMPMQKFKFVGTGAKTGLFIEECDLSSCKNIEVVPFLQKKELNDEYKKCKCLIFPSRQECWGLVINEAAAFGTPIISTYGSGAAIEFLNDDYLAVPDNIDDIKSKLVDILNKDNMEYSKYLMDKSKKYSIEISVKNTMKVIETF